MGEHTHLWVTVSTTIDKKRQYCKWCGLCREIDWSPPGIIEPVPYYDPPAGFQDPYALPPTFDNERFSREMLAALADEAGLPAVTATKDDTPIPAGVNMPQTKIIDIDLIERRLADLEERLADLEERIAPLFAED